jgi:hypothetical protein
MHGPILQNRHIYYRLLTDALLGSPPTLSAPRVVKMHLVGPPSTHRKSDDNMVPSSLLVTCNTRKSADESLGPSAIYSREVVLVLSKVKYVYL